MDSVDCQAPLSTGNPGNTELGCHFLLQEIFLTKGSNPCLLQLLYWQMDSLPLNYLKLEISHCNIDFTKVDCKV